MASVKEEINTLITNKIWNATCSGDIEKLDKLYPYWKEQHLKYIAFGQTHSLIMGALRNKEYKAVWYLIDNGETILPHETNELLKAFQNLISKVNKTKNGLKDILNLL